MQKYLLVIIFWVFALSPAWAKSKIHPANLFAILAIVSSGFIIAFWVAIWLKRKRK
ncbi:MAG: hypothetical protein MUE85_10970 [Microscillaceae bacterium]|nr:hypothetical protein [Microscillaceae bacterium]